MNEEGSPASRLLKVLRHWDTLLLLTILLVIVGMIAYLLWPQPVAEITLSSFDAVAGSDLSMDVVGSVEPRGSPANVNEKGVLMPTSKTKAHYGRPKKPVHPPVLNLNSASYGQLQLLPGIGPKMAQRIIDYRKAHGPFSSLEGVMDVSGIGPKKFEKLKPYLIAQ